jgi:hypothetical protein
LSSPCGGWGLDHRAWSLLVSLIWNYFFDMTLDWLCIWTTSVVISKLCCFRYFKLGNNSFELWCMWVAARYLWNVITGDLLCWIIYDLGLFVGWFEILHDFVDYRDYMCSSAEIWSHRWLFLYLCSYNLDGSVTLFNEILLFLIWFIFFVFFKYLLCSVCCVFCVPPLVACFWLACYMLFMWTQPWLIFILTLSSWSA